MSSTRTTPNEVPDMFAVRVVNGCVTLIHVTVGCPMVTAPNAMVPLLAGERIPVAVPESVTYAGVVFAPAVMASSPWRAPGCEGANVSTTLHEAWPAMEAPQFVVSVKSPASVSATENGDAPVLVSVTVCVLEETPVTATGVAKLIDSTDTLRFGFTLAPLTEGCGRVVPVSRVVRP